MGSAPILKPDLNGARTDAQPNRNLLPHFAGGLGIQLRCTARIRESALSVGAASMCVQRVRSGVHVCVCVRARGTKVARRGGGRDRPATRIAHLKHALQE